MWVIENIILFTVNIKIKSISVQRAHNLLMKHILNFNDSPSRQYGLPLLVFYVRNFLFDGLFTSTFPCEVILSTLKVSEVLKQNHFA